MTDSPLISVIVPVYRVEAYLKCCVDSIRNQTYSNLEIILVDDGSPDNCGALCDEMVLQDSRIRVIHKPNGGLSDARNAGKRRSWKEPPLPYVVYLPADMECHRYTVGLSADISAASVSLTRICVCIYIIPDPHDDS